MEYVTDHGAFSDVPYGKIIEMFETHYGGYFDRDKKDTAGAFEGEAENDRQS